MKHLRITLNIVLASSLLATVSCSDSKKSNPGSTEPDLTGYWKTDCDPLSATSYYNYFQLTADGTQTSYRAEFDNTECSGTPWNIETLGTNTIELGNVLSQDPWTVEFNSIACAPKMSELAECPTTTTYLAAKLESEKLYITGGECGSEPETRCTDFNNPAYSRMATEEVPTEPVCASASFCIQ